MRTGGTVVTQKVGRARQAGSGATIGQSVRHRAVKRFDWADTLAWHIKLQRLPEPVREYRPFAHRRFRLDCAWPDRKLFVECDGGEFLKASARRHGGAKDCERWNLLTLDGWTGFRFVGSQVRSGEALRVVEDALWMFPVKHHESANEA